MASPTELSLDCKPKIGSLVLKSYAEHETEGTQKLEEFVARLEEERVKINAFKRELPLCLQLLTNAMEASRQELQSQRMKQLCDDKAKWMESATLWIHRLEEEEEESGENGKGGIGLGELGLASSSAYCKGEIREVSRREGGEKEKRKARRCWSPHLHARFLHALHMLGGSQLATPKQITQLMKVEGLTSDEVKSHLQKYRLHNGVQSPNPVVVVGSIWVPPQYAAHGGGSSPAAFYAATTGRLPLPPP